MNNDLLIPKISSIPSQRETGIEKNSPKGEFDKVLNNQFSSSDQIQTNSITPLKFSSHALSRLKERSISLGKETLGKLENAVETAAKKGSKESLILSDEAAFIVSVKNKTVITVVDRNNMNGNVFTNIDSTVVI
ncbi:MAG: flagellar protein [Oligoflexia bacterium]|nr:flagellar protein [Oligoflexia bacterium]